MRQILDRLRALPARGAALLGVGVGLFALLSGLTLGGLPAGGIGYAIGFARGFAAADRQAEINRLARDAAEARVDAANARQAADEARADALSNAAAAALAGKQAHAFALDLSSRGPAPGCVFNAADLARLHDDAWAVQRRARRPRAATAR